MPVVILILEPQESALDNFQASVNAVCNSCSILNPKSVHIIFPVSADICLMLQVKMYAEMFLAASLIISSGYACRYCLECCIGFADCAKMFLEYIKSINVS